MGAGVYSGVLLLLLLGLAVVFVFCRFVPYNMDEFLQYHPIICRHYRFNDVDAFPEVCRSDDLDVLNTGLVLPLKSYKYVGSLPSLYYYPLFLLWKSPASARFMGVIFLIIQSLMLSRISNIRAEYIFLGLIGFFAYFFSHIVDTGPVGFQITSVYALYLLAEKWSERFEMRYLAAASILVFLGIWVKLS